MTDVFRYLIKPGEKREKEAEMNFLCNFVTSRVYLVSSFFGNREHSSNKRRGLFGLILWITNMCIHFAFDFYEAFVVFHVSWLTCQILFLILYIVITVYVHPYAIAWFINFVQIISKEDIHYETLSRLGLACKYLPYLLTVLCVAATACQYVCYAADKALTIHLIMPGTNGSEPEVHLKEVEGFLNVIRFTSIVHIFYTSFTMLFLICALFYSLINSQKEFNKYLGEALASHPASLSLKGAIGKFDGRCKILQRSSENMSIILSYLIVATSASCVVNAYNFLFIKRYAIYVWFSIAPLLWTVVPLVGAAMVTSCYQEIKFVVLESWMQIPDKFDEQWNPYGDVKKGPVENKNLLTRAATVRYRPTKRARSQTLLHSSSEPCVFKNAVNKGSAVINFEEINNNNNTLTKTCPTENYDEEDQNIEENDNSSGTDTYEGDNDEHFIEENSKDEGGNSYEKKPLLLDNNDVIKTSESLPVINCDTYRNTKKHSLPDINEISKSSKSLPLVQYDVNNYDIELSLLGVNATSISSSLCNISRKSECEDDIVPKLKSPEPPTAGEEENINSRKTSEIHNEMIIETQKKLSAKKKPSFCAVARTIQATKKLENFGALSRKFNYEKYLRVLEHTLDHTGFRIGKVRITWQRVDFIFVFLFSLVMMFAESAIL